MNAEARTTYVIRKADRGADRRPIWEIGAYYDDEPERRFHIGAFATRREAVTTAKLLAGWRHTVLIER